MTCETCKDWDMAIIVREILLKDVARCPTCQRLAWPNYPRPDDDVVRKYEPKPEGEK